MNGALNDTWQKNVGDPEFAWSGASDRAGNQAAQPFQVIEDTGAPTVTIHVPPVAPLRFWVSWLGQDAASGLRDYAVQYKVGITGTWTSWLTDTTQTQADFVGERDQGYYFRVQATDHVNNTSAWVEAGPVTVSAVTKYYYHGGQRIAMRQGDVVYYLHSDHLGSTSLTTDISGTLVAETRYLPYGEERWITGTLVTDFTFTGQRAERGFGLMDYNARYYDPWLGRFISADTVVPKAGNPQALNRYSYVLNRPLQGGDPTGHQGPWGGVLPPPTQPIDPVTLEQLAEALKQGVQSAGPYAPVVAGTAVIAAAVYVDIRYGGPMVADWAMQDVGPEYPLPDVVTPQSPNVQPTWVLPGTSTLTSQSQDVLRPQPPTSREDSTRGAGAHLLARKRSHTPPREAYPGQLGGKYQPDSPKQQGPPGKPPEIGAPPPGPWYERIAETIRDPNVPPHEKIMLAVYGAARTILAPLIGGPPDHP